MKTVKVLSILFVLTMIIGLVDVKASTYYIPRDDIDDEYYSWNKEWDIPECEYDFDNDRFYNHQWCFYERKKPTSYKKGLNIYECDHCGCRKYSTIPKRPLTKKEVKVKRVVKRYIQYAKKYNWKKMNKLFKSKKCGYGYPTKSPLPKYYKKYNKKIKYRIRNITGKGKKYTATADVWIPNLYWCMYNAIENEYYYLMDHYSTNAEASGNRILNRYINSVKKSKAKLKKKRISFKIVKTKKGWKIKKKTITMVDIATGFYASSTYDGEEDYGA